MTLFQIILAFISGILFSRGIFVLWEGISIYKKIDTYFYFSLTCFTSMFCLIFVLLLATPFSDNTILILHRLKIFFSILAINFWIKTVYNVYFKESIIPKLFHILTFFPAITIPFSIFLSPPITHYHIKFLNIAFDYRYAQTHFMGTFLSILIFSFFIIISFIKFLSSNLSKTKKILGILSFSPGLVGFNDFFIYHGFIKSIMLSEYAVFLFIFSISFVFIKIHANNHIVLEQSLVKIKEYNEHLEEIVDQRTQEIVREKEEKTNFFINLIHEFKTPLTLIKNYLNVYIKKIGTNENLEIIKKNINKLERDVINFFDIEKKQKGKSLYAHDTILDLTKILIPNLKLFTEAAKQKGIYLIYTIENNAFMKVDPKAIDRIFNNILDNAIKYTNLNGFIYFSLKKDGDSILLTVKDNGIGISKEQQNFIFKPFYQISHQKKNIQGIGIGLSIVNEIVNELKGKIIVKSEINKGTIIKIIFPRYTLKEGEQIDQKELNIESISFENEIKTLPELSYNKNKKSLLLIEDNKDLLIYLIKHFSDEYNVYYAFNGEIALKELKNIPKPDLIISDIMMDHMDGFEFAKELFKNETLKDIPLIFLTAKTSEEEKIKGLRLGAIDYIYKPFSLEEIKEKVKSIINNQNRSKELNINYLKNKIYDALTHNPDDNVYSNINNILYNFKFTNMENELLKMLFEGMENKEIAYKMNISLSTVKRHIFNIYQKLGVKNRVEFSNFFLRKINKKN